MNGGSCVGHYYFCVEIFGIGFLLFLVVWSRLIEGLADKYWLVTAFAYIPQHGLLLIAGILVAWSFWKKSIRMILLNLVSFVLVCIYFLGFNIPENILGSQAPRKSFRVVSYNLHEGTFGSLGIIKILHDLKPDIIALQEAKNKTLVLSIAESNNMQVVQHGEFAILSRFPVVSSQVHKMPIVAGRNILEANLLLENQTLKILNVHYNTHDLQTGLSNKDLPVRIQKNNLARWAMTNTILEITEQTNTALLVLGDFNTPPRGALYKTLGKNLQDAFVETSWGFGYSFRSDLPVLRIDYLWLKNIHAHKVFVPNTRASDHKPMVSDLMIGTSN